MSRLFCILASAYGYNCNILFLFCRLQYQLSPLLESLLLSQNLKSFSHQRNFQPLSPAPLISRMPNPRTQKVPCHGLHGWEGVVVGNLVTVTVTGIRMRSTLSSYHQTTLGLMQMRRSAAWKQRKPRARNIGNRQQQETGKGQHIRPVKKLKNNYVKISLALPHFQVPCDGEGGLWLLCAPRPSIFPLDNLVGGWLVGNQFVVL